MKLDFVRLSENRTDCETFLRIMDEQGVTLATPIGRRCLGCGMRLEGGPRNRLYCYEWCRERQNNKRYRDKKKAASFGHQ